MLAQTNDHVYIITNPLEDIDEIKIGHDQNYRFPVASQRATNIVDISALLKAKEQRI